MNMAVTLNHLKLVTFDATNTLLKFKMQPWHYYALVGRSYGYTGGDDDLKNRLIGSYKTMWKRHPNFGRDSIQWKEWWKQVVISTFNGLLPKNVNLDEVSNILINDFKTIKCWHEAKGSERLLSVLKEKNIGIGLISNFDPRIHDIINNISIGKYFDFIVTSYEFGHVKPNIEIFNRALSQCNKNPAPHESLHIGDDLTNDYEGARAAGWNAILINNNIEANNNIASKHIFKSIESLALVIDKNKLFL